MKPEIKEKFIKALRSGEYKQNFGSLRDKDCYCAAGVLCDLYIKENSGAEWERSHDGKYSFRGKTEITKFSFPYVVRKWAGIGTGNVEKISIVGLNDTQKLSFLEIAEKIENYG